MSHPPSIVRIGDMSVRLLQDVARAAEAAAGDAAEAIRRLPAVAATVPLPGSGSTGAYLSVLATAGAGDLTFARVLEPHLDALAILQQAGLPPQPGAYGVYAAERPGLPAVQATAEQSALSGTKPWCSLAGALDRALITAEQDGRRRLFDVDLRHPGAAAVTGAWISRGLAAVDSGDLRLDAVPGTAVGEAGWYLGRPGFAWGGVGVAACWFGGATGVAAALTAAAARRTPDQVGLAAIGEADRLLWSARCVLADAAVRIDAGEAAGAAGSLLAARVRGAVADVSEQVITLVGHALGPAPLAFDEEHARRVADLTVYVRQHHAARDDAAAGARVLETEQEA